MFRWKHKETMSFCRKHWNFEIPSMIRFGGLRNRNVSVVSVETKRNFVPLMLPTEIHKYEIIKRTFISSYESCYKTSGEIDGATNT